MGDEIPSGLTGRQLQAARVLIGMRQDQLADEAKLSIVTVRRAEAASGPPPIAFPSLLALVAALEAAGVEFTGDGVRLKGRHED